VILLERGDTALDGVVDASNFALHCTPAVNLFHKPRIDRIHVTDSTHEFHVVADRTRPLDFEIYEVTDVVGHGRTASSGFCRSTPLTARTKTTRSGRTSRRGANPGSCHQS
jgi:type VI secretion system protein ImpG